MTLIEAIRQATAHWSRPDQLGWEHRLSVANNGPNACGITVFPGDRHGTSVLSVDWRIVDAKRAHAEQYLITDALATMGRLQAWAELMDMPPELVTALTKAARLMEAA